MCYKDPQATRNQQNTMCMLYKAVCSKIVFLGWLGFVSWFCRSYSNGKLEDASCRTETSQNDFSCKYFTQTHMFQYVGLLRIIFHTIIIHYSEMLSNQLTTPLKYFHLSFKIKISKLFFHTSCSYKILIKFEVFVKYFPNF